MYVAYFLGGPMDLRKLVVHSVVHERTFAAPAYPPVLSEPLQPGDLNGDEPLRVEWLVYVLVTQYSDPLGCKVLVYAYSRTEDHLP